MNDREFRSRLSETMPEAPECFHKAMTDTLASIVAQEEARPAPLFRGRRALALALVIALLGTAAYAVYRWSTFDVLSFMTGETPTHADELMASNLHQETVNGVEITIREAGYDGHILFIQYSYRMLDVEKPFGVYEDGVLTSGIHEEAEALLSDHNVGWWTDHFWINGVNMDMFAGSGGDISGSAVPGEIIHTEYWRLDEGGVELSGPVEISLPIGAKPNISKYFPRKDHPEWFSEDGSMKLPDEGMVTFTLDTGDTLGKVITENPNIPTVNDMGTFSVSEVAFSPLMTYITLDMQVNPDALAAYIAENGEGWYGDDGGLMWPYGGMDVFGGWISSLELVDENGALLFPGYFGNNGYGNEWAEYLYPYIETIPEELWLAPVEGGKADLSGAIRVR